jgi:PIN domain nuclease of toxin-antitoxin system
VVVLDTHVLLWWASGGAAQLSTTAARTIEKEQASGQLLVSSICAWEISMLVNNDRLALSMDVENWLTLVEQIEHLSFVPVDNRIAVQSTNLPGEFHKDPADRIIVATARRLGAPLITADDKIRAYPHVRSLW